MNRSKLKLRLNLGVLKKKALIIGINYKGSDAELSGCINDARNVKQVLQTKYGYQICTLMTEEETKPTLIPTKKNIIVAIRNLVAGEQDPLSSPHRRSKGR